ncbi:hypothetical protein GGP41_005567 [Bipolaris sorokiniana]|uniref:Uncharacterized protein n=1 Tax=Cochliobolus sativus TaxID=45130 RepID=A0A8H5ZD73_COCSA|nr:hypothetical protein GGP41_005567 [Bipolaris sorokiniana]
MRRKTSRPVYTSHIRARYETAVRAMTAIFRPAVLPDPPRALFETCPLAGFTRGCVDTQTQTRSSSRMIY